MTNRGATFCYLMQQHLIKTRFCGSDTVSYSIFSIVKKPGVVIKPIQYEEINPNEKPDEPRRIIQRAKPNPSLKKTSAKQAKRTT